jgi:hypothetical protein
MLGSAASYGGVAIGVTVVATLVVVLLIAAVAALLAAARDLRREAEELRRQGRALLIDLDGTVAHATDELNRVDDLIGSAERLTATVGSATRMTRAAWASPVIKVMALGTGTARASERLRGRRRAPGREGARETCSSG